MIAAMRGRNDAVVEEPVARKEVRTADGYGIRSRTNKPLPKQKSPYAPGVGAPLTI